MTTSNISITVQDLEFAKDYQYFVTVQFANEKKRTDVSAVARNPIFTTNTFMFPIKNNNPVTETVTFTACVISEEGNSLEQRGQSKILGQSIIDLSPYSLQPSETFNPPIRQQMKFVRMKDGKQISVGRFIATFKVVNQQLAQSFLENTSFKKLDNKEIYQELPELDNSDFTWRIKAEIRCAHDIPTSNDMTPQAYVEVGWTEYKNTSPQESRVFQTNIINSTNPYWNNTILITNPANIEERKGFLSVCLKDKNTLQDISQIFVPLESMNPFTPYNLNIVKKQPGQMNFFLSLILEAPTKKNQQLFDIIVTDLLFEPLPKGIDKVCLILAAAEPKIKYYSLNEKQDSIQRILEFDQTNEFQYFMSQIMKVPPIKSSKSHRAATFFTIPFSMLKQDLRLYLAIKNESQYQIHQMPNQIVGNTSGLSEDLTKLLVQKSKKRIFVQMNYFKDANNPLTLSKSKCQVEIGSLDSNNSEKPLEHSQMSLKNNSIYNSIMLPGGQNQLNTKNTGQNNEILNRILKELDDKTESLRIAASEIIDLRKQVKLLQAENNILRKEANKGQDQIREIISREVETMGTSELKDKILKVAAMYKNERIKVKQLENTLKTLQPQVSNNMQLNSNISTLNNHIQVLNNKLLAYKKEFDRITTYKDTIKKQEKVIEKLERVMTENLNEIKKARQDRLQLEELKKKGLTQQQPISQSRHSNRGEDNQQKQQIIRLQRIIASLQQNMKVERGNENQQDRMELQFRLHKSQTRVNALEEEITNNARNYAKQIAKYKLMVAEKQALLDGFSMRLQ